jgi:shikimate kinase
MSDHLVLVGLMGVGKTTVGRALADQLDRPFLDSDHMIEARTGRTVREIWRDDGETAFRRLETDVLRDALDAPDAAVIAAAGGVVLSDVNRRLLDESGAQVVWLRADDDVLVERAQKGAHRPLLDDDPAGVLAQMAIDRAPLYQEVADAIVTVDRRSVNEVVKAVLRCTA